ncbi:MAG: hypothetical protein R3C00_04460 [Hyphomonas sp.]
MKLENVRYTVIVEPYDRSYPCTRYVHYSFYPEAEDALLEAESAWNLDNPKMEGVIVFVALGFGWDPRIGRPAADDLDTFRR